MMLFDLQASKVLLERMVLQDIQVRKEVVEKLAFQVVKVRFFHMFCIVPKTYSLIFECA